VLEEAPKREGAELFPDKGGEGSSGLERERSIDMVRG